MWYHDYDYRDTRRHMRYSAGGGWWGTDEKPMPHKFTEGPRPSSDEIMKEWAAVVKAAREKAEAKR